MKKLPNYLDNYYTDQLNTRLQFLSLVCIFITLPGISFFNNMILPHIITAYGHHQQALPQVDINATATPTVIAGQIVTYTLAVNNAEQAGPISASAPNHAPIEVIGAIGAGTKEINIVGGVSWNCSANSGRNMTSTIHCTYQGSIPIAVGESLAPIIITVQTIAGVTPNPLASQFLAYTDWDTSGSHVAQMATIVIGGQSADTFAALTVKQSHDGGDVFKVGQNTIYHFTVQNIASIDFTGGTALFPRFTNRPPAIELSIIMPPGADINLHRIPKGWSCTQTDSVIQCSWHTFPIAAGAKLPGIEIVASFNETAARSVYAPTYVTTAALFQSMPDLMGTIATNQVQILDQIVPLQPIPTQIPDSTSMLEPITPLPLPTTPTPPEQATHLATAPTTTPRATRKPGFIPHRPQTHLATAIPASSTPSAQSTQPIPTVTVKNRPDPTPDVTIESSATPRVKPRRTPRPTGMTEESKTYLHRKRP